MKIKTIGELRALLDDLESKWTKEDVKYLGELEHQEVRVPYFSLGGEPQFQGYGSSDVFYDAGLGLIFQQSKEIK